MSSIPISPGGALRSIVVAAILLAVVVALATGLHLGGLGVLGVVLWLVLLGTLAAGAFLIFRLGRPLAGIGTALTGVSAWLAFFWLPQPSPIVWSVAFIIGVALVAFGTRKDVASRGTWPLLLARVAVGWALVDNAQDHFRTSWLPGGGGFLQIATGAANRQPLYFLDPLYQGFLKGTVVPGADLWAGLTICGELVFGLLLALGLLSSVAAVGAMWQNANYMLMKGFVAHGAYTDKTYFLIELFCLITVAGLAYGADASLHRHVPSWVARWLMGASPAEPEPTPLRQPKPRAA